MTAATRDAPTTEVALGEQVEAILRDLDAQLDAPTGGTDRDERVDALRRRVWSVARSPAWRAHDLARALLVAVEDLRAAAAADPDGTDRAWQVREALARTRAIAQESRRRLTHEALDRPEEAARFVAGELGVVEVGEVARLLDITPRMLANYRNGDVGRIRKDPNRITLVGLLVDELRSSMTPRGVLLWFDAQMPALGGATPRERLDDDPVRHRAALLAVARGGRAQLDTGGSADGDLDTPA